MVSPEQSIKQAFSLHISVLSSPDVELVCKKNNLSFVEMLQPFSRLTVEGHIRDPMGLGVPIRQTRLSIEDATSTPLPAHVARQRLWEAVAQAAPALGSAAAGPAPHVITPGTSVDHLSVPCSYPWYDAWRETQWAILETTEQEFHRQALACILAVSSSHPDPLAQFKTLEQQLQQLVAAGGNRFFSTDVLKYYVVVHDVMEGHAPKAEAAYKALQSAHGLHVCHLLSINSRGLDEGKTETGLLDPWLRFLPLTPSPNSADQPKLEEDITLPGVVREEVQATMDLGSIVDQPREDFKTAVLPSSASTSALARLSEDKDVHSSQETNVVAPKWVSPLEALQEPTTRPDLSSPEEDAYEASKVANMGAGHGCCLTAADQQRLQAMVNDICTRAVLPFIERCMRLYHEAVSSRKSSHRSLFSATKRWLTGGKTGAAPGTAAVAVTYHPDAYPLQLRRLGDLALLVGCYDLAYTCFHSAKREFEADQAWLHYAGALEVAAFALFLAHAQSIASHTAGNGLTVATGRTIPTHYLDLAVSTYLTTCKRPALATRCAVLGAEVMRGLGLHSEAALLLIRLTGEDADLRSALLLEQAALCFLRSPSAALTSSAHPTTPSDGRVMSRKYAFHMILAGHRYGKAGQRRHAARAYRQALQVYASTGWSLAEDHVHYTIGQQSLSLGLVHEALNHLQKLLTCSTNSSDCLSHQPASQMHTFLQHFIQACAGAMEAAKAGEVKSELPILPIPVVHQKDISVMRGPIHDSGLGSDEEPALHVNFDDEEPNHSRWARLEEKIVSRIQGPHSLLPLFTGTQWVFDSRAVNSKPVTLHAKDWLVVRVPLNNPLPIPLHLSQLHLLWNFVSSENTNISLTNTSADQVDETINSLVETSNIDSVDLQPGATTNIVLRVRPLVPGTLSVTGLAVCVHATTDSRLPSVSGQVKMQVTGPRSKAPGPASYLPDKRLEAVVESSLPFLSLFLRDWPSAAVTAGQLCRVPLRLHNAGPDGLANVGVALEPTSMTVLGVRRDADNLDWSTAADQKNGVYCLAKMLESGKCINAELWIRSPDDAGTSHVHLLAFGQSIESTTRPKPVYRLVRHSATILTKPGLKVSLKAHKALGNGFLIDIDIRNQAQEGEIVEKLTVRSATSEWFLKSYSDQTGHSILPGEGLKNAYMASPSVGVDPQGMISLPHAFFAETKGLSTDDAFPKINVVVQWQIGDASGQHNIVVDAVGTPIAVPPAQPTQPSLFLEPRPVSLLAPVVPPAEQSGIQPGVFQRNVTFKLEYSPRVTHAFAKQRLCTFPVKMQVFNSGPESLHFRISLVSSHPSASTPAVTQQVQVYLNEAAAVAWVGRTLIFLDIPAFSQQSVALTGMVTGPGAYAVAQSINWHAKRPGEDDDHWTFLPKKPDWALLVGDVSDK